MNGQDVPSIFAVCNGVQSQVQLEAYGLCNALIFDGLEFFSGAFALLEVGSCLQKSGGSFE
ncbi:hypothetical protein TRAPUB_8983 [Trametes pubescens]|uniref:Uncharacterized protein n=1 Tax=Trametes pubescens TaxID=154538 RepID=A0A1M2W3L4_TRAPU|nr:hypothetical protein TRAPUB_8983 [Trametes pubescens]